MSDSLEPGQRFLEPRIERRGTAQLARRARRERVGVGAVALEAEREGSLRRLGEAAAVGEPVALAGESLRPRRRASARASSSPSW